MDELVSEFLGEATESLSELDTQLVTLEQNPDDREIIDSIFRVMHTIKGTCGFLGLPRLAAIAHAGEDILDNIRSDKLQISPDIISAILEAIDQIKDIMEALEEEGSEPEADDSALIARLHACAEGGGAASEPAADAPPTTEETPSAGGEEEGGEDSADLQAVFDSAPGPDDETTTEESGGTDNEDLQAAFDAAPGPDDESSGPEKAPTPPPAEEKPAIAEVVKKEAVDKGLETAKEKAPAKPSGTQSIRVNLNLLENLMQMASELVLTRNQLQQISRKTTDSAFTTPLQRLSNITTDLQESVMKTRMQPIGNAWAKFPRLIRDLSIDLSKKIELKMVGAETELDRQMLEMVKDPLTHMVRNAADHGLDTPEERLASGKDETGTITLSSYHEGGHIIVKISDDGRGINRDKVCEKAIENGLVSANAADSLTDKQIYQFILKPGFSTAEKITAVSGRGVGMDVVVSNIEEIGGTLEVDSVPGKGSDFIIKLPLTLAIMSVLVVESRGERFGIPQIRVSEIVQAMSKEPGQDASTIPDNESFIEKIKDTSVLRLRGKLLSLISLGDLLALPEVVIPEPPQLTVVPQVTDTEIDSDEDVESAENEEEPPKSEENPIHPEPHQQNERKDRKCIVICEVGSSYFGIVVDKVFDTEEIVVKPKSPFIKDIEMYSGCTILGDGGVIMILDPNGIMKTMGDVTSSTNQEELSGLGGASKFDPSSDDENVTFLLFKAGGKSAKAVPLELVSRLEEIDMSTVEWAGDKQIVQYRGNLMRLITTDDSYSIPTEGISEVIVFTDDNKILGLVVEEVLDITSCKMDVCSGSGTNGVLTSMVINNKTHDMIDVGYYFDDMFGDWLAPNVTHIEDGAVSTHIPHRNILLVDDSPFFRKFMKPILVVADYNVTTAESAHQALEIMESGVTFDAVITDIDMPEMTGVEFVRKCKADDRYASLPFIALTSHTSEYIEEKEGDVGFSGFVSKSDREQLVETISSVLSSTLDQQEAS